MLNFRSTTDKVAIGLSMLCIIHCLVLPLLVVALPAIAALPLQDDSFHKWMVFAVIPISAYALIMGCKKHQRFQMLLIGAIGIIILAVAAFLGHDLLGEELEKIFTVIGALTIAFAHVWNFRLCKRDDACQTVENTS